VKRVAERVAETTVKRFDRERATVVVYGFTADPGDLEVEHRDPVVVGSLMVARGRPVLTGPNGRG